MTGVFVEGGAYEKAGYGVLVSHEGVDPVVITVVGEVDAQNADEVQRELLAAMRPGAAVVLDLSEVGFLDSSGLRALLAARKHAETAAGSFGLRAVSAPVLRSLTVSGLLDAFPMSAS